MKKVCILSLITTLLVCILSLGVFARTTDNEKIVEFLVEKALIQGDEGNLMLDQELTREQMVVLISRLLEKEDEAIRYPTEGLKFSDVPQDSWAINYIAWAYDKKITEGYDEYTFGYGDKLTVWQTKAFMIRALGYIDITDEDMMKQADKLGISFNFTVPDEQNILRGDMLTLLYNTLHAESTLHEIVGTVLGDRLGVLPSQNKKSIRSGNMIYYVNEPDSNLYKMSMSPGINKKMSEDKMEVITISNDWVYYKNLSDDGKLYRIHTDGTSKTKIGDESPEEMIVSGESIYYTNKNDGLSIYMINTEGTKKLKLNNDSCKNIHVVDDQIFYLNSSDGNTVYCVNTNGTSRNRLYFNQFEFGSASGITDDYEISNNWIYYSNANDNYKLYKIKLDGTQQTKLNDKRSKNIRVSGDYIYYNSCEIIEAKVEEQLVEEELVETQDLEQVETLVEEVVVEPQLDVIPDQIARIKINGTDERIIVSEVTQLIDVKDGWIYYKKMSENESLFKIKIDSKEGTKVLSNRMGDVSIVDDIIYYSDLERNGYLFTYNIKDNQQLQRNEKHVINIVADKDWVYFTSISDDYKICRTNLQEMTNEVIAHEAGIIQKIEDGYVYHLSLQRNELFKVKVDGTGWSKAE